MKWLSKCLSSCGGYEVIVIDNASSDNTVAFINQEFPQVKVFSEKTNLGFGQANNKGISEALKSGADYVYLLNQDAYLENDTISKLIDINQKYSEYGVLSPIHTNAKKDKLDKNFSNYVSFKYNERFYSDFVLGKQKQDVYQVPFVNAAGWLLSKECLMRVGGFDPIFFHYGEDDNYCQRVRFHGFKIGVVPSALMVHDREDRETEKIIKFSDPYFKNIEKRNKVNCADINQNNLDELKLKLKNIDKRVLRSLIKLRFEEAQQLIKLKNILKKSFNQIKVSRKLNKKKQPNYLNLQN